MESERSSIDELTESGFILDVDYTLQELEWEMMVGPFGLGKELLQGMTECGADFFQIDEIRRTTYRDNEVIEFCIDGEPCSIRFDYDVPFTATLLGGLRRFLNRFNTALRRVGVPWRFVCIREQNDQTCFDYRIVLVPEHSLLELTRTADVVAGVSLEEFESLRTTPRPRTSSGTSEAAL